MRARKKYVLKKNSMVVMIAVFTLILLYSVAGFATIGDRIKAVLLDRKSGTATELKIPSLKQLSNKSMILFQYFFWSHMISFFKKTIKVGKIVETTGKCSIDYGSVSLF